MIVLILFTKPCTQIFSGNPNEELRSNISVKGYSVLFTQRVLYAKTLFYPKDLLSIPEKISTHTACIGQSMYKSSQKFPTVCTRQSTTFQDNGQWWGGVDIPRYLNRLCCSDLIVPALVLEPLTYELSSKLYIYYFSFISVM